MCTETFLRLPEEKRNRFLEAAWEEFTTVPFSRVSINQIIRRARIPRGSFYQYFADKTDLFTYLLNTLRERLLNIFQDLLREAKGDVFLTAMKSYDSFLTWSRDSKNLPLLTQWINVMRINPHIEMENFLTGRPEEYIREEFLREINTVSLRRRDEAYVVRVCCMAGMSLGEAMIDTLCQPERAAEYRRELAGKLEILQWGCLLPAGELEKGGVVQ